MYMDPWTNKWMTVTTDFSDSSHQNAYLCEQRGNMVVDTYRRLDEESPVVRSHPHR